MIDFELSGLEKMMTRLSEHIEKYILSCQVVKFDSHNPCALLRDLNYKEGISYLRTKISFSGDRFFSSSLARNLRRPKEAELSIGHVRMSPKFSLMISQSFPASGRKVHGYPSHVQEQYELLLRAV